MAGEELFPELVREKAKSWHWGNHSLVTLHLALRHAPVYRASAFDPDMARAYNIFFGMDNIDEVASCFEDCAAKKFPTVMMGNGACNSQFDPTYAPPGQHAAFWWPFAPYSVDGGPQNWEDRRAEYTERVLNYWRDYASNLDDQNVLGSTLFTPLDVERLNINMRQGAVRMGAYVPNQLGINRPHPLMPGSSTPVERLYLCGSFVRQWRRGQRRGRLYRGQCDCRRFAPEARLDSGAAAGMEALKRPELDPEKREPVFGKDHAQAKSRRLT